MYPSALIQQITPLPMKLDWPNMYGDRTNVHEPLVPDWRLRPYILGVL